MPLDFQEFMLAPVGAPSLREAVRWCAEVFHRLKTFLREASHATGVGDEGGYAPNLKTPEEALQMLVRTIGAEGYKLGDDIAIALDPAASEFHQEGQYVFAKSGMPPRSTAEMIDLYKDLAARYPIVSIEDGLGERDWEGWRALTQALGDRVMLVGDDVFVTNPAIIRKAIAEGIGNATGWRSRVVTRRPEIADTSNYSALASPHSADNWLTIGSVPTLLVAHSFTQSERLLHQRARLA